MQGQCWCYFKEGVIPSRVCGYPDGYSGEYHSLANSIPWTKEMSPWNIMTTFGKVPWERHVGMVDVGPIVLVTYVLPIVVAGEIFSRTHNQSNTGKEDDMVALKVRLGLLGAKILKVNYRNKSHSYFNILCKIYKDIQF